MKLAPFVRIYNSDGTLVIDGVTRFSYVFSERADDASNITIETNNVNLPDHPDLQEGKKLVVTWGYLGDTIYQKRTLYLWDIKSTFNAQGVRLELEMYCKAAYLMLNSSKNVHKEDNLKDLAGKIANANGLDLKTENLDPGEEPQSDYEFFQTGWTRPGHVDFEHGGVTQAVDNTSFVRQYAFKKYNDGVPQANRSDKKMLDELAMIEPIDNLFITGRDELLLIQRRDFNQKPYKVYKWRAEPGFLLEFTPASKNVENKKFAVAASVSGWNEEEGEYLQGMVTRMNSGAAVLGDTIDLTDEDKIKKAIEKEQYVPTDRHFHVDGLADLTYEKPAVGEENPVKRLKVIQNLEGSKNPVVLWTKRGTQPAKLILDEKGMFVSAAIDNTTVVTHGMFPLMNPKEYLPTVETKPKEIAGAGLNRQSQKEFDLNEAQATVLGDASLVCSKVITILGVSKKYSGHYYAHHVQHEITPVGGYKCYIKLYVTSNTKIGSEAEYKQDVTTLGLNKNLRPIEEDPTNKEFVSLPTKD